MRILDEDVYLEPVVGPWAEFHNARLIVEGEVSYIHGACAPEFGGWGPEYVPVEAHHRLAVHVTSGVIIGTRVNDTKYAITSTNYEHI